MSYQLIQAVDHGSRFLNMDQVVSMHFVAEGMPGKPLDYMVCFTTTSIHANYKVKFDELQDALEYVK